MKLTKSIETKMERFLQAIIGSEEQLVVAGKILVEMIDENPETDICAELLSRNRNLTSAILESLENVGRGRLKAKFLLDPSPAAQRAIAQALPIEEQAKLTDGYIPVAREREGKIIVQQCAMSELSPPEARRAIADGKVRTAAEQVQQIKLEYAGRYNRNQRYETDKNMVRFFSHQWWTWAELQDICTKIAPKASEIGASIKANQLRSKAP